MPRISYTDQLDVVRAGIQAAPEGRISHNDLVATLEADGQAQVIVGIPRMVKTGDVASQVVAQPGEAATLWYTLPEPEPMQSDLAPSAFTPSGGDA